MENVTPTDQTPLKLLKTGKSVIAYGVPLLRGVLRGENLRLKRYNVVETCRVNDEIGFKLAHYLEKRGYESVLIHADAPVDLEQKGLLGDLSLRHVAAEAGLGEIGLSTNFICK